MSDIKVTIDKSRNVLVIELPLQAPSPSASGKTLVVASSRGNHKTEAVIDGKNVIIGLNAYIPR